MTLIGKWAMIPDPSEESDDYAPVRVGETVGLTFRFSSLSLFDAKTGMAIQTAGPPSVSEESAAHG